MDPQSIFSPGSGWNSLKPRNQDLNNRKNASGYNNPSPTTVEMGKSYDHMQGDPTAAHLGSQSTIPSKED